MIPDAPAIPDGRGGLIVLDCPYCHRRHHHGEPYGHRIAHCGEPMNPGYNLVEATDKKMPG